jgi:glycerol kinase
MAGPLVLAIDAGTTGVRAMLLDRDQNVTASAYREFPQVFPHPGWVEHDPDRIWEATQAVVHGALAQAEAAEVLAVGITNQRETALLWDRETGRPVHNAIVWQCRRTAPMCARLEDEGRGPTVRRKTGLPLDPYFSATKWRWLLDNVPEAERLLNAGRLAAGTVDTWILWNLTGGDVHATEPSNASRTSLFNVETLAWDDELCELFGVPASILPEVRPTDAAFGVTRASASGIEVPVLAMIGDQQSAAFAQGCYGPDTVKCTYGTGLFMLRNTGRSLVHSEDLVATVAWNREGTTDYALEGSVFTGGAVVQWLRDGLHLVDSAAETEAMAASLRGNDGVYFVPALSGLGAPRWDPSARGTIIGITRATSRAHIVRAALEAIAYRSRDVLDVMARESGGKPDVLHVDGGAAANDFLMQFVADVLDTPVERPAVTETTALGAAGLAGIAAGLWAGPADFVSRRAVERTFAPHMAEDEREHLYGRWKQAVDRAVGWA